MAKFASANRAPHGTAGHTARHCWRQPRGPLNLIVFGSPWQAPRPCVPSASRRLAMACYLPPSSARRREQDLLHFVTFYDLEWLEVAMRFRPVTPEVAGSSPVAPAISIT